MDHAAFLEAIVAHPDDDTPRLVYADWLEERGDPRGAFIRAQCALERLGADDPRRAALEDEADELLETHQDDWLSPFPGRTDELQFRRGFVELLVVDSESLLSSADKWFRTFPLRRLTVRLSPRSMPALAACPHLAR